MPDDGSDPTLPRALSYQPVNDSATARRSVRVARFGTEIQAAFVANLLERAGIPTFLFNTLGNAFSAVNGLTPVELHVRPEDQEQAAAILADLAAGRVPVAEDDDPATVDDDDGEPRCPRCRSWQVRPYQSLKDDFLRLFRLRPPVPEGVLQLECLRCGHRWVDVAQKETRATRRAGSDDSSDVAGA